MDTKCDYDVVVIGGAYSGAAAGILLRRRWGVKVLIVEPRTEFDRKVGESTSDVAGCFLSRILRVHHYLAREHIAKQGLRFWFTTEENQDISRCGEMGSFFQTRVPGFQVDRSTLDEHLLETAVKEGCELWRPAKVRGFDLGGIGKNSLEIERDGQRVTVTSQWVIDASGKAAVISRKRGTMKSLETHPTNSMWARFRNVKDLDSHEVMEQLGAGADAVRCARSTATNHLSGNGWWSWLIPLRNGDYSAGLTWDPRLFTAPGAEQGSIGERLKGHLCAHPVGKAMFKDAEVVEHDARAYSHLPYYTTEPVGEGWACVGDAAGFMDPLYSQGLDYCSHTVFTIVKMVGRSCKGECVQADIADYRSQFHESYFRWYRALYHNKYHYLGDAELMWVAFVLDIGTYFIGPVRLVYSDPENEFARLPYFGPAGKFFSWWMSVYNRRLGVIAQKRLAAGIYGKNNLDRRWLLSGGFTPDFMVRKLIFKGLWAWAKLELKSLFLPSPAPEKAKPTAAPKMAEA